MKSKWYGFSLLTGRILFMIFLWGLPASGPFAYADEKDDHKKDLPQRDIHVATEFTGIIITEGEDVSMDISVFNRGKQDEAIEISFPTVPTGWEVWTQTYSFTVTGAHVKGNDHRTLTLKAKADQSVGPGRYAFLAKARTADGALTDTCGFTVTLREKGKEKKTRGINISTSYPVLQGPTDSEFEFSLEVENKLEKDTIFNMSFQEPQDWNIRFKPAYEEKYISSLRIKAGQSQTMAVEVKPNPWAEPGEYPFSVKVSSETAQAEVQLMIALTGTYKLDSGTADGLLSLTAFQGKPANLSFYVKNSGSANQESIRFLSFKPENWQVEFKPETIQPLPPGELKQVELTITPADQALVGDYAVSLSLEGEKVTNNMELRVTVKASTAWGWIGIGIIVLVIAGLVVLFIRLGRR